MSDSVYFYTIFSADLDMKVSTNIWGSRWAHNNPKLDQVEEDGDYMGTHVYFVLGLMKLFFLVIEGDE